MNVMEYQQMYYLDKESNCGTGMSDILFDEAKFFANNNKKIENVEITDDACDSVLSNFIYDYEDTTEDILDLPNIGLNLV